MDENIFDKDSLDVIKPVDLKKTMETSYINYAMSVIASRALPDVRDGLKPVQRRILYAMIELNNGPDKPHRKCARIVGDAMGKYHPHGDSSIYGALVNMAQEWSTRYPLVDGHGNFGSVDGDGAAAMRYTEARLSKISMEMLADINKNTVDFVPNFDETEKEPAVLPARFPNLLVNGTSGIAVGMATNIPPHNLKEVIGGVVKIIDNIVEEDRETSLEEIMEIIKGPDFPTGATILGRRGIEEAYRTGRGKIRVRAVTNIETMANGKNRIVVTELPYMVNKAKLVEKIAELHKDKRIDGITDLRDESSREGMRICIELRKDANANVVLNQLYKHTQMQDTFGVNMLALVDKEPKVMNLLQMLQHYLTHQEDVVTRRIKYDLNKAEERAHIIKGLLIALDNIDEVIRIIRGSKTTNEAKEKLMNQADYVLSTIDELKTVLSQAEELLNTYPEQNQITAMESLLQDKINDLQLLADKTQLKALYDEVKEYDESKYTTDSWEVFSKALNDAKAILDKEAATQDEVEKSLLELQDAIKGLKEKSEDVVPDKPTNPEQPDEPNVPETPTQPGDNEEKPQQPVITPTDPDDKINGDVLGDEVDTTHKKNTTVSPKVTQNVKTSDATLIAPYAILSVCAIGMYMVISKREQ